MGKKKHFKSDNIDILPPLDVLFTEIKSLQPKPNEHLVKTKLRLKYKSESNYIVYPFKPISKLINPDEFK